MRRTPFLSSAGASLLALSTLGAAAAGQTSPTLEIIDQELEDASGGGSSFAVVRGNLTTFQVGGAPGRAVVLAMSPTPPPADPPVLGGVELAVDPQNLIVLVSGLADGQSLIGPGGTFELSLTIPAASALGGQFWMQALTADPGGANPALSAGVELVVADALLFDFEDGPQGWQAGFSDYPVGEELFYELGSGHGPLPAPLDGSKSAFRIQGHNHSDDLYMFLKRELTGLQPGKSYQVLYKLEIASMYPEESVGIGGSPGASVYLKAGATAVEPQQVDAGGFYVMNVDKGNQSMGGADLQVLGTIGIPGSQFVWTLIQRDNLASPTAATADANGSLWISAGTDSGFEGLTELYYDRILIKLF